uniref:Bromodomain adjacent to zinc finger domain 2B n=1 Tax=Sphaeramia orbicularis TaxID=375764 RepID=A0A673CXZ6_9TELE
PFSVVSGPAFGCYISSSGRSDFGGLGGLGLSAALAAHSQFGTFPDWWRAPEVHTRGAAAFFPHLLGGIPVFTPTLQSRTSGVNGTLNGRNTAASTRNYAVNPSPFIAEGNKEKNKATDNINRSQKSTKGLVQLQQRTKEKKPGKRLLEAASMSGSQSGSLSDSSSDYEESSSDPDDLEEEDNDDDEDEDDQSNESELSDSEKEIRRKSMVSVLIETFLAQHQHHGVPLTSSHRLQASSHPAGLPQSTALFLRSPTTTDEEGQQHISVIQAVGLAVANSPIRPSQRDASPLPSRSSPKQLPPSASPKPFSHCSSPKPLALCSPSKPLSLSPSPKPSLLSTPKPPLHALLAKPPGLLASQKPLDKPRSSPPPKHTHPAGGLKESKGKPPLETSFTQDRIKSHKNSASSPSPLSSPQFSSLSRHLLSSQHSNEPSLFLNYHTNGALSSAVQDAPLALITKPRGQSSTPSSKPLLAATSAPFPMPVNLSTGTKEPSSSSTSTLKNSASPAPAPRPRKPKSTKSLCTAKNLTKPNLFCSRDSVGENQSEIHNSKDSDDSLGDDDDDDDGDDAEDSGSSLSESESNLESNSDGTDNDSKQRGETEADSDAERTPQKLAKASSSAHKSSSSLSANCSALNLKVFKPSCLPSSFVTPTAITSLEALSNRSTTGSFTFASVPESGKRRRVTDEKVLRLPLEFGWQRETRIRTVAGRLQGEVSYFAPCGKKLRQYPDVMKGLQWVLLADEEITSRIIAMDGRRSRRTKLERQPTVDGAEGKQWRGHHPTVVETNFQDVSDAKLLRKLEAQEIARQAAQIKMMRKLEKQAMAQAAKEARKQQAIMAAEERRKKKEQMKILKQQEKIKRIQQIRMEKELRAQQILEVRPESYCRNIVKHFLSAVDRIKKPQPKERERRRQHMMLMKAVEARKKAEEKERLRKEKKDEKRLNKERKLELRRLELEKAKELKKPNEDMCLADHKPLPELSRIPGLVLSGSTFSDCLMVLQFLHSFGKVLDLSINSESLTLSELQEGLLSIGDSMGKVQDLLVSMVSAAVCDPGIPQGHKNKTALGEHLTNVEINRDNVSEILQIYMESHSEQSEVAALALSLRTKAFQAHTPSQKAFILAFLVNELCCSKSVMFKQEISPPLYSRATLQKTGKRDSTVGEDNHTFSHPTVRNNCKRKEGDSEEEEDDDEDSEDQGEDEAEEEEETGGKKGKKAEIFDEEVSSSKMFLRKTASELVLVIINVSCSTDLH